MSGWNIQVDTEHFLDYLQEAVTKKPCIKGLCSYDIFFLFFSVEMGRDDVVGTTTRYGNESPWG
jgi:hypothetical protein